MCMDFFSELCLRFFFVVFSDSARNWTELGSIRQWRLKMEIGSDPYERRFFFVFWFVCLQYDLRVVWADAGICGWFGVVKWNEGRAGNQNSSSNMRFVLASSSYKGENHYLFWRELLSIIWANGIWLDHEKNVGEAFGTIDLLFADEMAIQMAAIFAAIDSNYELSIWRLHNPTIIANNKLAVIEMDKIIALALHHITHAENLFISLS